jgi:hypothetical protein
MRPGIAVLLLAWASTAGAQQIIWKCKGPKGSLVYQNSPCAPGAALATKVYDTPSDLTEARAERERNEQIMEQRQQQLHSASGSYVYNLPAESERDKKKALCKEARDRAHRAAFDGTPDLVRQAYERAAVDQCFGL